MQSDRLEARLDTSLESLLECASRDGRPKVLATIVATTGSTYRKPGARMFIMADGDYVGLLSGGCLEADLKEHAMTVLAGGIARAVEYDMRGPDDVLFGIGAGCEGAMRVLLEPAGPGTLAAGALADAGRATLAGRAASLVSVHESAECVLGTYDSAAILPAPLAGAAVSALRDHASSAIDEPDGAGRTRAFVQFLAPPPRLLLCGAGPDAQPVAGVALKLGWRVSLVDHRRAYANPRLFPGAEVLHADARDLRKVVSVDAFHASVVMSHHMATDVAYLDELAEAGTPGYVGLLGPRARRRRIAEELGASALKLRSRLHGPVGIDIGAVTPEGIALAIVSQIHAWLAGRRSLAGLDRAEILVA